MCYSRSGTAGGLITRNMNVQMQLFVLPNNNNPHQMLITAGSGTGGFAES